MYQITLNEQQEKIKNEAVKWFYKSSKQVLEIDGKAGCGKSVLMFEILKALGLAQNQIYPMAYTGQAAIVMRTKGFTTARSIHSTLYEVVEEDLNESESEMIKKKFGIPGRRKKFRLRTFIDPSVRLFFIDEGYMVPDNMVKDILSFGVKVIVCGDAHQLPPVVGQPAFLTGSGVYHLSQIMRQSKDSGILYIADRVSEGKPIHTGQYGNDALVINEDDLIPEMFGFADCVVCGTNRTREYTNKYIRSLAGYYSDYPFMGEQIICRKNNWEIVNDGIALANGLRGTVMNPITPSSFNGKTFKIDFKPDLANTIFYDIPVNCTFFTSPLDVKNEMKSVLATNRKYKYEDGEYFEFAYALTSYLSQGGEYANGIYIEEFLRQQIQCQNNYTGVTRFKNKLIYVKKSKKYF